MALGKHQRTQSGAFRKERSDSLIKNLRKDYPELANVNGNMKLGTLKERLNVDSLSQALRKLREG